MSAEAQTSTHDHGHGTERFNFFVQVAMILAVITGVEIIVIYLPFASWLLISTLAILSAIKFLYVIFIFMHLRWDKAFCTIVFFIGMILGGGTLWALLLLFGAQDSIPPYVTGG